ncbi:MULTISPECIES: AraC family transcriptional regulator [Shewanella]|uniref:helix-turn-helix domain-containing protein n=1 Tax=Shewanella TaxID=22 RepID=UPI0006D67FD3|nr:MULTISPECIES: AraC family transcriptional regulator [Shewanella]KPZ72259.1 HTH-type transcriptional activator RhaS [Shewanella sp. P1-14-1]
MIHWLRSPSSPSIAKYVQCYWLIEKRPDVNSHNYPKLNPDPATHLIISPANQAYRYDTSSGSEAGKGSHWLYPHQNTFELDHSQPFIHLGVKFHIGALYSLPEFFGKTLPLDTVEQVQGTTLLTERQLNEDALMTMARTDAALCCQQLDALLMPWFEQCTEDQHSKITRKALHHLDDSIISSLGEQLHCSQRTLERSFQRVTGLTLKQCQSMNKLEAMLEYLYQRSSAELDWAEIALNFGFSDQPHLIRYLKKQLGFTPKTYEKERGLTIDIYGGVSSISS